MAGPESSARATAPERRPASSGRVRGLEKASPLPEQRNAVFLARHEMVAERLLDIAHRLAGLLERVRHLARLLDRHGLFCLAVDEEDRRRELLGEEDRRHALEVRRLVAQPIAAGAAV